MMAVPKDLRQPNVFGSPEIQAGQPHLAANSSHMKQLSVLLPREVEQPYILSYPICSTKKGPSSGLKTPLLPSGPFERNFRRFSWAMAASSRHLTELLRTFFFSGFLIL